MKRPDGTLIEEYITYSLHALRDGKYVDHASFAPEGYYTGRFCFHHKDGKYTRWYRRGSAPKWLLALYDEATNGSGAEG